MVQSPFWAADWLAASQEIPRISRNPKVHYCTHKRPPPVLILGQSNPVQSIYPHPTSWRSILILSTHLRLGLPSGLFPSGFPTKNLYTLISSPIHATCPAHLILLDFITRTILGEEYRSFSFSLCSLLHSPVTSSLLRPNIHIHCICDYCTTQSSVWCWNLDAPSNRSETPGKFWNVVLEKNGKDQLHRSCKKWRSVT